MHDLSFILKNWVSTPIEDQITNIKSFQNVKGLLRIDIFKGL